MDMMDKADALPTSLPWPLHKLRLTEPLASSAHRPSSRKIVQYESMNRALAA